MSFAYTNLRDLRRIQTGMTFSGGSPSCTFLPSGFLSLAAAQEITICDSARTAETGRKISISVSGRIAVSNATCS